ncbi:flagellar transcriptional regulator FlhD [Enterobacter roggenkampii]|nr:flagellar transcriptional regulator FlhD [Enterobacter roggenkampii]
MHPAYAFLNDIHNINMSYLLLLQRLSCSQEAHLLTGINGELLDSIRSLPLPKLVSLADTNQLIITIRKDILSL